MLIGDGIEPSHVVTVYEGIDLHRVQAEPAANIHAEFWLPKQAPIVGAVAALTQEKGHEYLIEAAALVVREVPDARFVILGEGELRPALERQVKELHLDKHVVLPGFRADILSFIKSFDLFVMSSLFEGLGTSLLDAMALSKATVASDTGGIPEVVSHGETGLLVPPRDATRVTMKGRFLARLRRGSSRATRAERLRRRVPARGRGGGAQLGGARGEGEPATARRVPGRQGPSSPQLRGRRGRPRLGQLGPSTAATAGRPRHGASSGTAASQAGPSYHRMPGSRSRRAAGAGHLPPPAPRRRLHEDRARLLRARQLPRGLRVVGRAAVVPRSRSLKGAAVIVAVGLVGRDSPRSPCQTARPSASRSAAPAGPASVATGTRWSKPATRVWSTQKARTPWSASSRSSRAHRRTPVPDPPDQAPKRATLEATPVASCSRRPASVASIGSSACVADDVHSSTPPRSAEGTRADRGRRASKARSA